VAFEGVLPGDFTGSSNAKALFCTGIGFHFWHGIYIYDLRITNYDLIVF